MALASSNDWHIVEIESSVSAESSGTNGRCWHVVRAVHLFLCLVEVSILFPTIYFVSNLSEGSKPLVALTVVRVLLCLLRITQFSHVLAPFFSNFLPRKFQNLCCWSWRQDWISLLAVLGGALFGILQGGGDDDADIYFTQPAVSFVFSVNVTLFVVDFVMLLYNVFCFPCLSSQGSPPKGTDDEYADLKVYHPVPVKLSAREFDHSTACCICLGDFEENDDAVQLPCEHVFHRQCAREWLLRRNYCPLRCPEIVLPPRLKAQKACQMEQDHQDFTPVLPGEVADV